MSASGTALWATLGALAGVTAYAVWPEPRTKRNPLKDRLGLCYELSGQAVFRSGRSGQKKSHEGAILVHGSIQAFGNPRINHAWVILKNGDVFDPVLDQVLPRDYYYQRFNAVENVRYDKIQVAINILKYQHWGPWEETKKNPILLDINVVDTSQIDELPGIGAVVDSGELVTYHVTDHPERIASILRRPGVRLMAAYGNAGAGSELGAGLYVSGNPAYWIGRARGKWDFLKTIQGDKLEALAEVLYERIEDMKTRHWLSATEYDQAMRTISHVAYERSYEPSVLIHLANQPYNIPFWKPEFLTPLGIEPGQAPRIVEIRIKGLLADAGSSSGPRRGSPDAATFRALRRAGVVGAFTRASMATNPELVLWDARAVTSVREVKL